MPSVPREWYYGSIIIGEVEGGGHIQQLDVSQVGRHQVYLSYPTGG